jgi:hypothetical protein
VDEDRQWCAAAGVPPEVGFATKLELARSMIERCPVTMRRPSRFYDFTGVSTVSAAHRRVVRSNIDTGELAYFWRHTPAGATAKGQVGLGHYQVRSWPDWRRHITVVVAARSWVSVTAVRAAGQRENPHPADTPGPGPTPAAAANPTQCVVSWAATKAHDW